MAGSCGSIVNPERNNKSEITPVNKDSSSITALCTRQQTVLQRLMDWTFTRLMKLPPATHGYTVARDVPIPMRDGVVLLADVLTPVGEVRGTLLARSPYGWPLPAMTMGGGTYASRGYRVILARCRGTFGSGGELEPMQNEVNDGADTVAWMRQQPWFDGRFATFGGSYVGFTQWALLMDPPPEMVAAVIFTAPHDFHQALYADGAFNLGTSLRWSDQMAYQESSWLLRTRKILTAAKRTAKAFAQLPMLDATNRLLKGRSQWHQDWASRRDKQDPFWQGMKLTDSLDKVTVPVLLQGGWQDLFLEQTLEQYECLARRDVDVALTMGPWTHSEMVTKGGPAVLAETLNWFAEHLSGEGLRSYPQAVNVFINGREAWHSFERWPPAANQQEHWLQPEGGLANRPAAADSKACFRYDPADPTPTFGGRIMLGGGYADDTAMADRGDLLVFVSEPLAAPLSMIGVPCLELMHETDNPYVDLYARVSEMSASGQSSNVSEGFIRLDPTEANGLISLKLDVIAHEFKAGSRIRLVIAGGCHPRFERNLGTGADQATSTAMKASKRTLKLAQSRLLLPIVDL